MKKAIIAFLGLIFCIHGIPSLSYGQHVGYKFGRNFMFDGISLDDRFMVTTPAKWDAPEDNIDFVFDYFFIRQTGSNFHAKTGVRPKSPILLGVKLDSAVTDYLAPDMPSITRAYSAYLISDSSEAIVLAMGINTDNVKDYQYHVVQNDSVELVPWSPIRTMEQHYGAKKPYAFLGKYRAPGKQVLVEVVNTKDYSIRDGVVFDWKTNYKPVVTQIIVLKHNNIYFNLNYAKLNCNYATRFDTLSGLPLDLKFPVDSLEVIQLDFKHHETLPYMIYLIRTCAGVTDTTDVRYYDLENFVRLESKYFDKPGKYQLLIGHVPITYTWDEKAILRIPFEVFPPPLIEKKVSVKQLLPYGTGAIATFALAFTGYYRFNKRRLKKAAQQKETIDLQLKSIRSQLNPHFMFNALAAIQGLMNKNDTAGANHYLAKFADLTRQVLHTGEQEMISLEDELKMLDDYLQMEQLRFGFTYGFTIDEQINRANTEIPPMLLQPFVENAVKHGVATLHQQGRIEVSVQQDDQRLVLTVKDNGRGFDPEGTTADASAGTAATAGNGFGLKLSGQRIVLLNQKYRSPRVALSVNSGTSGTIVRIELDQWV